MKALTRNIASDHQMIFFASCLAFFGMVAPEASGGDIVIPARQHSARSAGVVPVEDDGSAHFLVPANANIFFQALDENYLAVQTGRTFVNYMPGETRSCVGCHGTPNEPPPSRSGVPLALRRKPSLPGPQPGESTGRRSGLVPTIGENHPKTGNIEYLPAKRLGSHNSLLIAMLAPEKL